MIKAILEDTINLAIEHAPEGILYLVFIFLVLVMVFGVVLILSSVGLAEC